VGAPGIVPFFSDRAIDRSVTNWMICHDIIDMGLVLYRSEGPDTMLL
jgi:hypothetical protein